ncbi:phosphoserine phosphatase SerB [Litorimonas sp. RW-G-Af-16]|uniref:phosphoserine phosphatase SerB n=1 Tax=Litorimonas sp. RW-G-Af-16 TaxID=3241168 RepID=UPI00390C9DFD
MPAALPRIATIVLAQRDNLAFEEAIATLPATPDFCVLAEGKAFECTITNSVTHEDISEALQASGIEADIGIFTSHNRRKKLLICDMDSTLIGQECIDELADFAGVKDRVSEITERAMRGELDFEDALTERVSLLKGLDLSVLQRCYTDRITINPGAKTLCQTMKAHGAKTVIVSGGFTFFTERVAKACGFEAHQANVLLAGSHTLLGTVQMPILGREAKLTAMQRNSQDIGGPDQAVAIGDGANDLAMIQAAGLGIAYHAKPVVAAQAHCAITCTDLRTALYYQGFSEDEFVDAG